MMDLMMLIEQCAPRVAPSTIQAIIRTESNFNPLALNVNGARLHSQPRTVAEAVSWSQWLIEHQYSVDMGLMQINSRNLPHLKLTPAEVFDPCRNIQAGAAILQSDYELAARIHGPGDKALLLAVSSYNTGSFERGFRNGYVDKVVKHAGLGAPIQTLDIACETAGCVSSVMPVSELIDAQAPGLITRTVRALRDNFIQFRFYVLAVLAIVIAACVHRALLDDRRRN